MAWLSGLRASARRNTSERTSMQKTACTKFVGAHLIEGAGHWVQQEQPAKVAALVVEFLRGAPG